jgi:hypothetical protein
MASHKYLLVKGISGLGNRVECLLTAILYARLSRRRLIVDWSDHYYSNDGTNAFHEFFHCALCDPNDEIPVTDSVAPPIWRGHLHESAWFMRSQRENPNPSEIWRDFSIDLAKTDYQEDVVVMWTYNEKIDLLRKHFRGCFEEWSKLSKVAILRKLLRDEILLQPRIRRRIDQFKAANFGNKTVGVHVRYTDHRTRLLAALHRLNRLLKHEHCLSIFLSTDNAQIKSMLERSYPRVVTTPHWFPSTPGLAMHTDNNRPNPIENGHEALIDLYLLAECHYLIIDTSSSFAHIAALLTNAPNSNIFDIRRRGKQPARLRRITHGLMLRSGLFSWGLKILSLIVKLWKLPSRVRYGLI